MSNPANFSEVRRALSEKTSCILEQIPVSAVQLSLPLDGRGARIRASVQKGERARVPRSVDVEIDGQVITIPIEAVADYAEVKAY